MLGLLVFLIVLLLVVYVVKLIIDQLALPGNVRTIAYLILALFVLLWLFGGGGWGHVYGWRL